jgi:zinc transporter 1
MGLSKTNRILILLVIDTAFFLLELIAGLSALVTMAQNVSFG